MQAYAYSYVCLCITCIYILIKYVRTMYTMYVLCRNSCGTAQLQGNKYIHFTQENLCTCFVSDSEHTQRTPL